MFSPAATCDTCSCVCRGSNSSSCSNPNIAHPVLLFCTLLTKHFPLSSSIPLHHAPTAILNRHYILPSQSCLDVRFTAKLLFLRHKIEKGLRAIYILPSFHPSILILIEQEQLALPSIISSSIQHKHPRAPNLSSSVPKTLSKNLLLIIVQCYHTGNLPPFHPFLEMEVGGGWYC